MTGRVWRPHSVKVRLSFAVLVDAFDSAEAERYARQALEGTELDLGFGNGEKARLDGGLSFEIEETGQ